MKFVLDAEQRLFGETLRRLLADADLPKVIRAWPAGARPLWSALAEAGVFALAVPERFGGAGPLPAELAVAALELGRAGTPGPWVETIATAELLTHLTGPSDLPDTLPYLASGDRIATLAYPPHIPYALDADLADLVLLLEPLHGSAPTTPAATSELPAGDTPNGITAPPGVSAGGGVVRRGVPGRVHGSLDPARRLFEVAGVSEVGVEGSAVGAAYDLGVLVCAAQLVGLGRALLDVAVDYAKKRQQFGRPIGEFQAIKHQLADGLTGLEFATPLVFGAALSYGTGDFRRDVSAAKVAAGQAAYAMARTALQVHGAIGYTDEYDPSLLIRKVRALYSAWGTPAAHRARVLAAL